MTGYSRENPSERYKSLLADYKMMHVEGYKRVIGNIVTTVAAEKAYQGEQLLHFRLILKEIIEQTGAKSILDYGCGKGEQHEPLPITGQDGAVVADSLKEYWGVDRVHLYDPGVEKFWDLPDDQFDGVISTDVLEHIPVQDIPWVVEEQFKMSNKFVFANIACYPALATLPDGSNAHVTVNSPEWWDGLFCAISHANRSLKYVLVCVYMTDQPDENGKMKLKHAVYTNLDNPKIA